MAVMYLSEAKVVLPKRVLPFARFRFQLCPALQHKWPTPRTRRNFPFALCLVLLLSLPQRASKLPRHRFDAVVVLPHAKHGHIVGKSFFTTIMTGKWEEREEVVVLAGTGHTTDTLKSLRLAKIRARSSGWLHRRRVFR